MARVLRFQTATFVPGYWAASPGSRRRAVSKSLNLPSSTSWHSQVFAPLGAGNGPAGNHFIFLGNGVLNGPMQVRVTFEEAQNLALVRVRPNGGTRDIGSL